MTIKTDIPLHAPKEILEGEQARYGRLILETIDTLAKLKQQYDLIEKELSKRD